MARTLYGERDTEFDAALDAMDAEQLRELVRDLSYWLDDATQARLTSEVVEHAARASGGWSPSAPSARRVEEIEAFVKVARRAHRADASAVDDCLLDGTQAFLARDYAAAFRIFRALLIPIGNGDVDLGQDELVDEVLGVDVDACAKQYVISMYMTSSPRNRPRAVCSAMEDVQHVGHFFDPLRELERVAIEPLPGFDDFLVKWRALIEERVASAERSEWDRREHHWLREVVALTEGPGGLAEIARRSRRPDDLRAWCRALVESGDWKSARGAYEEAAELVEDCAFSRGAFLDGAALAAQELGADDLDAALERAFREAPSLARLRRWLGLSATRAELVSRAGAALEVVPAEDARQRALLHLVRGELLEAAELLVSAGGLGWSGAEHPGPLVFPHLVALLGGGRVTEELPRSYADLDSLIEDDGPELRTPTTEALVRLAGLRAPKDEALRSSLIGAMRKAAEKRVSGVTEKKRRRHYGHAASLVAQCAEVDGSPRGEAWLREVMDSCRRYPALTRELRARSARS